MREPPVEKNMDDAKSKNNAKMSISRADRVFWTKKGRRVSWHAVTLRLNVADRNPVEFGRFCSNPIKKRPDPVPTLYFW